jgi:thioredoxin-related protein
MKNLFLILFVLGIVQTNAQQTTPLIKLAPAKPTETKYIEPDMKTFNLYNPYENVDSAIKAAEKIAAKEGKHIFLQMGGNWCIWCARFNAFTTSDKKIDSIMKAI